MSTTNNATSRLLNAKKAYFESGEDIMEDEEYDVLEEIVRRDGQSAIIDEVGWKPSADGVKLPYSMPSLKKIKPGESSQFYQKTGTPRMGSSAELSYKSSWIVSEKLDGVSALWTGTKLYMRGNGVVGRDITPYMKYITGLQPLNEVKAIRGEICLTKEHSLKGQGPARSQVNGWLHRDTVHTTLKPRFIAYQVLGSNMTRRQQFEFMDSASFEVPSYEYLTVVNDGILAKILLDRKEKSAYDIDGIVIGTAEDTEEATTADAPKTQVAFKMPLDEQCALTEIVNIEWNMSRLGYLMPRVQIKPVAIGGAKIEWVTGHNAEYVMKQSIGPGAKIKIRRSGDVIPIIDTVINQADNPQMPVDIEWTWDGVNAKAANGGEEQLKKQLLHTLKTLKVEGAGPSAVEALWVFSVYSFRDLLNCHKSKLTDALGPTLGPRLIDRARIALAHANLETLIVACPLSRGTGASKINAAIDKEKDITKWISMAAPSGWSCDAWAKFIKDIPGIIALLVSWGIDLDEFSKVESVENGESNQNKVVERGEVCFTGFRNAELEAKSEACGFKSASGVKKGLKALIIPDSENPSSYASSKADKARQYGIKIMRKSEWEIKMGN